MIADLPLNTSELVLGCVLEASRRFEIPTHSIGDCHSVGARLFVLVALGSIPANGRPGCVLGVLGPSRAGMMFGSYKTIDSRSKMRRKWPMQFKAAVEFGSTLRAAWGTNGIGR